MGRVTLIIDIKCNISENHADIGPILSFLKAQLAKDITSQDKFGTPQLNMHALFNPK